MSAHPPPAPRSPNATIAAPPPDDDAYRIEGSFAATLAYQAQLGGPLDEGGETLDVAGTFAVESLPRRVVE